MLPVIVMIFVCLCGCEQAEDLGSLSEFSHPYAGEYVCETLTLGGNDCLEKFEYVKLTLKSGGSFELIYKTERGAEGGYRGEYKVAPEGDKITLTAKRGSRTVARTFPMEQGAILINLQFGGKLLYAKFAFPR